MTLERYFRPIAACLLALLAFVQVSSMLGETQTWDEGIHLASGYTYLRTGDYELSPEHPPLGRLLNALPLLAFRLEFDPARMKPPVTEAGFTFVFRNRLSPDVILSSARGVTIALTLVFAAWVARWTSRRFGPGAALIALALFVFDPNLIAHGRYVTTDLIAAFTIFLASTLWLDYLTVPSRTRLVLAGVALGAALSSKYSALFLIPVLALTGLFARRLRATIMLLLIAAAAVVLAYTPELVHFGRGGELKNYLKGQGVAGSALQWLAATFHLPRWNYLIGIDRLFEQNTVGEQGYLLGGISDHGWWYYFPVALLVKTPVGTLLAGAATALMIWRAPGPRGVLWALAAIPAIFFGLCCWSSITIGHRHILPIYAFLFVLAGAALARYPKLAAGLVLLVAMESLSVYPHYLAFFNIAAGGPANGPRYLVDSNVDWGQDLRHLSRYLDARRINRVCLAFFGNVDPLRYGVEYAPVPRNDTEADCVVAISVTPLQGLYANAEQYAWIRSKTPDARIGYSIYVYDLRKPSASPSRLARD